MPEAILRQIKMLSLIPKSPRKTTCAKLQKALDEEHYRVTIRTIQRDLNSLSTLFPLCGDEENPQGWSWLENAPVCELPSLDPITAMTFLLAERFLRDLLPPPALAYLTPYFIRAAAILEEQRDGALHGHGRIRYASCRVRNNCYRPV